jgi:hypothetical protein
VAYVDILEVLQDRADSKMLLIHTAPDSAHGARVFRLKGESTMLRDEWVG